MAWTEITRRNIDVTSCAMQRHESWGMGADRAAVAGTAPARASARARSAHDHRRDPYLLATGCQWRALPRTSRHARRCRGISTAGATTALASDQCRLVARAVKRWGAGLLLGRIIDSQSAPTPKRRPARRRRWQAHQGRKRHIVTDTQGFLLAVLVHEANIQDPHGAVPLLRSLRRAFPAASHLRRPRLSRRTTAQRHRRLRPWTSRSSSARQRQRLPASAPAWVVERTFAWLGRSRRLAKDFEQPSPVPPLGSSSPTCAALPPPRKSLIAYDSFESDSQDE